MSYYCVCKQLNAVPNKVAGVPKSALRNIIHCELQYLKSTWKGNFFWPKVHVVTISLKGPVPISFRARMLNWYSVLGDKPTTWRLVPLAGITGTANHSLFLSLLLGKTLLTLQKEKTDREKRSENKRAGKQTLPVCFFMKHDRKVGFINLSWASSAADLWGRVSADSMAAVARQSSQLQLWWWFPCA